MLYQSSVTVGQDGRSRIGERDEDAGSGRPRRRRWLRSWLRERLCYGSSLCAPDSVPSNDFRDTCRDAATRPAVASRAPRESPHWTCWGLNTGEVSPGACPGHRGRGRHAAGCLPSDFMNQEHDPDGRGVPETAGSALFCVLCSRYACRIGRAPRRWRVRRRMTEGLTQQGAVSRPKRDRAGARTIGFKQAWPDW
jgi:hypothetical protein